MKNLTNPFKYFPRWLKIAMIFTYSVLLLQSILFLSLKKDILFIALSRQSTPTPLIEDLSIQNTTLSPSPTPSPAPTVQSTSTPGIGSTKRSEKDNMEMVFVPAGEFIMGANTEWENINGDELPEHSVFLDAFWIDRTEVTTQMYADFLNAVGNIEEEGTFWLDAEDSDVGMFFSDGYWKPREDYTRRDSSSPWDYEFTKSYPVFEVTWYGADAYCMWAGKRLPTDAEWEKAARGTSGNKYPWGNNDDGCYARVSRCWWIVGEQPLDVGNWPEGASPYGALDMLGNVWEWTADWYDENYYGRSPKDNPIGPENGRYKTIRGSSWEFETVPITRRSKLSPELSDGALGFRCAMDAD